MTKILEQLQACPALNACILMRWISSGVIACALVAGSVKASFFRTTHPDPLLLAHAERQSVQLDRQEQEDARGLLLLQRQLQQSGVKLRNHKQLASYPTDRKRQISKRRR